MPLLAANGFRSQKMNDVQLQSKSKKRKIDQTLWSDDACAWVQVISWNGLMLQCSHAHATTQPYLCRILLPDIIIVTTYRFSFLSTNSWDQKELCCYLCCFDSNQSKVGKLSALSTGVRPPPHFRKKDIIRQPNTIHTNSYIGANLNFMIQWPAKCKIALFYASSWSMHCNKYITYLFKQNNKGRYIINQRRSMHCDK